MNFKIIALVFTLTFTTSVWAQEESLTFKEKMRPWVEKIVGAEWSLKLLGAKPVTIELPPLPKVKTDTKSTAVYDKKMDDRKLGLSKEEEQKINYFFVKELYASVRGVEPQGDELGRWMNALDQGGTREGIFRALILDNEYAGLENYNKAPTDGVVTFTKWFFPRFLGLEIPHVEKVGFYTLKREASEKALEIVDAFSDRAQMVAWYAVFSAELAQKYPEAFKIDLRKSSSKERHKRWAETNPEQHIKSELIIKLHTVYNFLER